MYGFATTIKSDYNQALALVTGALKQQGFGILSHIDVQATFKTRLDIDIPAYTILGACNPTFANQSLAVEPEIGLLLPCNVVVRSIGEGLVQVSFMDPEAVLKLVDNPQIPPIATQVKARLQAAMHSLPTGAP
ncbi:hypothetical protein TI04_00095 [Achromatium sp. WMS2]|nr:hypothetical protein TI04_00095 [Achromatium sp. WMS2]